MWTSVRLRKLGGFNLNAFGGFHAFVDFTSRNPPCSHGKDLRI